MLEELVHSIVKVDQVSSMFGSFSSSQNAKLEILSASLEEIIERRISERMHGIENLLIGRSQDQVIVEMVETSATLIAYQRVLDENVELAGDIQMVARDQMLMDKTLTRFISNYDAQKGKMEEDMKQGTNLKPLKKKQAFRTII